MPASFCILLKAKNVISVIIKLTTSVPKASNFDLKLNPDHHKFIFSKIFKSSNKRSVFDDENVFGKPIVLSNDCNILATSVSGSLTHWYKNTLD